MIFYTHFGRNSGPPYLTEPTIKALRYIKEKNTDGELMVTTTSKLLNYSVHHQYLYWHSRESSDTIFIQIDSIANEVEGRFIPAEKELEGITFYVPDNQKIILRSGNASIPFIYNDKDETGRYSISVRWRFLQWPLKSIKNTNSKDIH
jgi:hypothetical protein